MIHPAYRIESTVAEDGTLRLQDLPFRPGEALEVILIPRSREARVMNAVSLHGSVLRYDDPTAPVAEGDWELSG